MDLYLGVDGGGSGCRAAVADAAGRVLGTGEGGAANIMSDPETARSNILQAMATALAQSGTGATPQALHAVLGLAGANIAEASGWLAARLPFASARIVGDAEIAARGALGPADGVTAAIGTGSIFAIQRAGHVRTLGGWGFRLGDQGGGARLGQALLETALLAHDGLLPRSPLLDAVVAEAGGPQGLVRFAAVATPADFATLAPASSRPRRQATPRRPRFSRAPRRRSRRRSTSCLPRAWTGSASSAGSAASSANGSPAATVP